MKRLKRTRFWGKNEDDDRLVVQILEGTKTATACPAEIYYLPDGENEDGGFEVGDLVEVYDLRNRLRCIIRITEFYNTTFGRIPEKLWRGEGCKDEEEFRKDHLSCWSDYTVTDDFEISVNHFVLVEKTRND